jgi:hypothetical protein
MARRTPIVSTAAVDASQAWTTPAKKSFPGGESSFSSRVDEVP